MSLVYVIIYYLSWYLIFYAFIIYTVICFTHACGFVCMKGILFKWHSGRNSVNTVGHEHDFLDDNTKSWLWVTSIPWITEYFELRPFMTHSSQAACRSHALGGNLGSFLWLVHPSSWSAIGYLMLTGHSNDRRIVDYWEWPWMVKTVLLMSRVVTIIVEEKQSVDPDQSLFFQGLWISGYNIMVNPVW